MPPTAKTAPFDHGPYRFEQVATSVDCLEDIGQRELHSFAGQGYLVIRRALDANLIEGAGQAVDFLLQGGNPDFRGVQIEEGSRGLDLDADQRLLATRKLMNFVDFDPRFIGLAHHPGLLTLLEQLMGAPPVLFQEMALLKPPRIGREKPWHQDSAYFNVPLGTPVIGVWIALDPATPENGCLHLIPGSHREDPMPHFKRRDWQICDTDVASQRDVMVPLEPGGCLLWHGQTHHGSPQNRTDQRRRALQFHYKPQDTATITTQERMALYGGDVRGATC
ncbi:MAG: hypothetical protein GKR89_19080 [Candidatus Latescibacteria bacterium]|nr:hypothetical protein [Candidatus Latescibacterota bacterium]